VADTVFERASVGRHCRGAVRGVAVRLLATVACLIAATAISFLSQLETITEGRWVHAAGGHFVGTADAGRRFQRRRKDDFGDNDFDGRSSTPNYDSRSSDSRSSDTKNNDTKGGNDGSPQAKSNDSKSDGDDRSQGAARNGEGTPDKSSRNGAGGSSAAANTGPPKTVAEAITRFVKWMHPNKPPAMPSWSEAKVTRAPREDAAPQPVPAKIAQKTQSEKAHSERKPASRAAFDLSPPLPATYRPNELLVFGATPAVLSSLRDSGWRQSPGVAQGVARFVSEGEDPVAARKDLASRFGETHFGLNYVYDLANDGERTRLVDGAGSIGSCDPQRCYGPELIEWRAHLATCTAGVKIGVIDTTVDTAHPALAWKKLDVRRRPGHDPTAPPHSHGTGVLSLLTGHPKSGTPGLIPDASYVVAEAFETNRFGKPESNTEVLLWALEQLDRAGAQIINMSLTGPRDELVHQRLMQLSEKGVVFVAAAGNGGRDAPPAFPAAYRDEVIAVTAVGRDQRPFAEANRGDYIDLAAPGVRIWTAMANNKQGMQSGTSFAAPFVTALVAAIYKNALLQENNRVQVSAKPEAVALAHLSTNKIERDDTVGMGLVRAPANCAGEPRQVPTARLAPTIDPNRWEAHVEYVSARPRN
jgi:hypothetical protein